MLKLYKQVKNEGGLIKIFLKRAKYDVLFESIFNYRFDLLKNNYKYISQQNIENIKQKYNYDEFCRRISPIIDEEFSLEELEEINKFLSSSVGKKMMNKNFALKMENITEGILDDMGKKMVSLDKGRVL